MLFYLFLAILFFIIIVTIKTLYKRKVSIKMNDKNYYFKGSLNIKILTNTELDFYKKLKILVKHYDLVIFPKIRLADIITTHRREDFSKINSKHIDFTICKEDTSPILFIELDDKTHLLDKNKSNDAKKDYIFERLGTKIIRVKTNEQSQGLALIEQILKDKTT